MILLTDILIVIWLVTLIGVTVIAGILLWKVMNGDD